MISMFRGTTLAMVVAMFMAVAVAEGNTPSSYDLAGNLIYSTNGVSPGVSYAWVHLAAGIGAGGGGETGNVFAGQINWNWASSTTGFRGLSATPTESATFWTYCTQLDTNVYFGGRYYYKKTSLEAVADISREPTLTTARATAIKELFGNYFGLTQAGSTDSAGVDRNAAALQEAIWAIIYNTPTSGKWHALDSTQTANFYASATDGIGTIADYFLQNLNSSNTMDVAGLAEAGGAQNQCILAPAEDRPTVPLPATAMLGGVGLLGLVLVRACRNRQSCI